MPRFRDLLLSPFSFLGSRSREEDRLAAYLVREHGRGRSLAEILDDPYLRNRFSSHAIERVLERPDVIHALGEDVAAGARSTLV